MERLPSPRHAQHEQARLAALMRYDILDTAAEAAFDRLARLAAQLFQVPIALVSLVDRHRQWFKACIGVNYRETGRSLSFCAHALDSDEVLVVPDATRDDRFRENALVTQAPHLRFYAGAPLITPDGFRLGTLCIQDTVPHPPLTPTQETLLRDLAASVVSELELRLALAQRRRTEAIHAAMLAAAPEAIILLSAQGIILEWNPTAERLFGYSREEMIGRNHQEHVREVMGPEASENFWHFLQTQSAEQIGREMVEQVPARDGQCLPVEVTVFPVEVEDERLYALVLRDRTAQEQARQELTKQRNLLQTALDGVPEAMYVKDLDRRYLMVNAAATAHMGRAEEGILGCTDEDLFPAPTAASFRAYDRWTFLSDQPCSYETTDVMPDGRLQIYRTSKAVYRDGEGQVAGLVGISIDVTEQRAAETIIRDHNARLAREVQDAQLEILERLARAAEYRDDDTGEHMARVGTTAAGLAHELGLAAAEVELIRRTAPLHDVGKIGISDSILLKPGRLSEAEFAVVRTHSRIGAEILRGGHSPLVQLAETISLTHHERWDGQGYPAGLRGEAIPLVGRIVAVADVLDALTSERPYKRGWSLEAALAEITAQAGRQFDPQVVAALHRLLGGEGDAQT